MQQRLVTLLFVCAIAAPGQKPAAAPAAMNVVDVAVLDATGNPVTDLTAADFEVRAADKPVTVERLTFFDAVRHTAATRTATPSLDLTPDQIHRTTVFVLDDLCLSVQAVTEARGRLHRFVDQSVGPADRVAILRTSGGSARERQLTGDKGRLIATIDTTESLGGTIPNSSCAVAVWTAVSYALNGLEEAPGRKALVVLSGDVPPPGGNAADEIERVAAASMTAVYMVAATGAGFTASMGGSSGVELERVAAETGGWYSLAFSGGKQGVQVICRRAGVMVRGRRRGFEIQAREASFAPPDASEAVPEAMNSPFAGTAIELRVTPIPTNTRDEGEVVGVICHMEARDLSYLRDEQGRYHLAFAGGAEGVLVGGKVRQSTLTSRELTLSPDEYRRAVEEGIVLVYRLHWGPGPRDVRVVVTDLRSGRIGSASGFVHAQNLMTRSLSLSGIVLKGGESVRQGAAVRAFPAGTEISFAYNVFNAATNAQGRARIEVTTRLIAGGMETMSGKPTEVEFETSLDPLRRQLMGKLRLDPTVGPGRYVLLVTVTDRLSTTPQTASQAIDFLVR